jgi:hypothetical protein
MYKNIGVVVYPVFSSFMFFFKMVSLLFFAWFLFDNLLAIELDGHFPPSSS